MYVTENRKPISRDLVETQRDLCVIPTKMLIDKLDPMTFDDCKVCAHVDHKRIEWSDCPCECHPVNQKLGR